MKQAVDGLSGVFSEGGKVQGPSESEIKDLHAKIGKLAVKNDFGAVLDNHKWGYLGTYEKESFKQAQTSPFD